MTRFYMNMENYNYWRDHRVIANLVESAFVITESNRSCATIQLSDYCLDSLIIDKILRIMLFIVIFLPSFLTSPAISCS